MNYLIKKYAKLNWFIPKYYNTLKSLQLSLEKSQFIYRFSTSLQQTLNQTLNTKVGPHTNAYTQKNKICRLKLKLKA